MKPDFVDYVVELWAEERPDLDMSTVQVVDRLLRISQALLKELDAVCQEFGVSFGAFAVLAALRRAAPSYQLTPTALYRAGMVTSGAMTKRLTQLERAGLVERVPDKHDGRSVHVRLTKRGRKLIDALIPAYLDAQRALLAPFSGDKQKQLGDLLRQLLLRLEGSVLPYGSSELHDAQSANAPKHASPPPQRRASGGNAGRSPRRQRVSDG